jgi:outer membrane protein assembly factor BamB
LQVLGKAQLLMRILLAPSLLLLVAPAWATAATPQNADPVGGWYKPSWEYLESFSRSDLQIVPDSTGDGKADILLANGLGFVKQAVLNGITGEVWFDLAPGRQFPTYLEAAEVNGDGLSDFFVIQPYRSTQGLTSNGRIELISGGSGFVLWQVDGKNSFDRLGERTSIIDLDGDQMDDILSFVEGKFLAAISGKDGSLLWRKISNVGSWMAEGVDTTGDGISELVMFGSNKIALLDGATGVLIWSRLTRLGDVEERCELHFADLNHDGVKEVVVLDVGDYQPYGGAIPGYLQAFDGASGLPLWISRVNHKSEVPKAHAHEGDWTADGTTDFFIMTSGYQGLIDGTDGFISWERRLKYSEDGAQPLLSDLDQDGLSDLLIPISNQNQDLMALQIATGKVLWKLDSPDKSQLWEFLAVADFDLNGTPEVVCAVPEAVGFGGPKGTVMVLHGSTGNLSWKRNGTTAGQRFGKHIFLGEADQVPGLDLIVRGRSPSTDPGIGAYSGLDGSEIWYLDKVADFPKSVAWSPVDPENDGEFDLLEIAKSNQGEYSLTRIDLSSGLALLKHKIPARSTEPQLMAELPDADQDGMREMLIYSSDRAATSRLQSFPGGKESYVTGLTLTEPTFSIADGGKIEISIDFHATQGQRSYQLLLSEVGPGPTLIEGTEVPLSFGNWLISTYQEHYPANNFYKPTGILTGAGGDGTIVFLALPNRLDPALAGVTMYMAVVTRNNPGEIKFSSGVESILIMP